MLLTSGVGIRVMFYAQKCTLDQYMALADKKGPQIIDGDPDTLSEDEVERAYWRWMCSHKTQTTVWCCEHSFVRWAAQLQL